MNRISIYLHSLILIQFLTCVISLPVGFQWDVQNSNQSNPTVNPTKILSFMRKFGYLNSTSTTTADSLYHEEAIIAAVKNMQKYGALNETGVLDSATIKLLTAPRCGVADIPKIPIKIHRNRVRRYALGSRGWQKKRITYFISNWSPKVGEEKVSAGMKKAFQIWSKYSGIRFVRVFQPDADIIVAFGSSYHGDYFPFDGQGGTLAHAFYPYEMSSLGGDIHFDNDENWKENATNLSEGVDFQSVATHELGHSLGLAHSPIYSSIMFPYYKGPEDSKDLAYDDIMAMYDLYIRNGVSNDEESTRRYNMFSSTEESTTTRRNMFTYTEESSRSYERFTSTEEPKSRNEFATSESSQKTEKTPIRDDCDDTNRNFFSFECNSTFSRPNSSLLPNICHDRRSDTVALIRGEIFVFKKEYVWRLTEDFQVIPGYPVHFNEIFQDIPNYVRHIDAAYERKTDGAIILFYGKNYWIYDGYTMVENSPRPITDYGFPESVQKLDAAMVWSKNGRTYLFSGARFIRYNEDNRQKDAGYPMILGGKWRGIPNNIDAAISMTNGKTFFFKGDLYWMYNNHWIRPERGYPRRTSIYLLNCLQ